MTTHLISHISYLNYASTLVPSTSSHFDSVSTMFPEDVIRYPDGSLQMKAGAKTSFTENVVEPIRSATIARAEEKYPIRPGSMWTEAQMRAMYKTNVFENRNVLYKGLNLFGEDVFDLHYHGQWTKKHLMSMPQNDIAFHGELPRGCVTVTTLFQKVVQPTVRRAYEKVLVDWIGSMSDKSIFGLGSISFRSHASKLDPLIVDVFRGRSAQVCLDVSQASQNAINWLMINQIHFCSTAVIDQIRIEAVTDQQPCEESRAIVCWP